MPENRGTGRPWASTARSVTGVETPTATARGRRMEKPTTSALAVAEMVPAAPPRTVTLWRPGVANVTRAVARPFTNVTEDGRVVWR